MLKLQIENFDKLADGGPLEISVDRRGFDFGRDQHLDWTLPDKNRIVSGKHCEVRFYDDAYWLFDVSTNGTFLNSNNKRMQSPYRLRNGDKLSIGDYIIAVQVEEPEPEPQLSFHTTAPAATPVYEAPPPPVPPPTAGGALWEVSKVAPPPIDSRDLMPPRPEEQRAADFLHHAMYVAPPVEPPLPPVQVARPQPVRPPASDVWGTTPAASPDLPSPPPAPPTTTPVAPPTTPVAPPSAPVMSVPEPAPQVYAAPAHSNSSEAAQAFLTRFAVGAGLPAEMFQNSQAGDVAEEAGRLLNMVCGQLMAMLHARAEAKTLSRSSNRTLIQQSDNNPLKFMPTAEEALRVMLGPRTKGYLESKRALESSFTDLKMHQVASLAAMQAAVTQLFDDLAPDAIEKSSGSKKSILTNAKAKNWETYVQRWEAKVGKREHGMLGVFLDRFAEQYDKLSKRS